MDIAEEYLDVVDDNDTVVGSEPRSAIHARGDKHFRTVSAFLKNSSGKLWIPRRAASKIIAPGGLDMSIAGHVQSGESYEEALAREALEEVRLDIEKMPVTLLGTLTPMQAGTSSFQKIYEIPFDAMPDYNTADFTESFWLLPREVLQRIESGEPAKSDLPILLKRFYLYV